MSVAVALAGLCAACSGGGHSAAPSTTPLTTSSVTPTTEPAPTYPSSPFVWQQAKVTGSVGGGSGATLAAVLAPNLAQPWTAAGTRTAEDGTPTATVWTSTDAVQWTATALTAEASQATSLAEYRGRTVVGGSVGQGAYQQAAVWVQAEPGGPFTTVVLPRAGEQSRIDLIAYGALGAFATGTVDGRFAAWSSTDGREWLEQTVAEKVVDSSPGAKVTALLAEGDKLYAAGSVQNDAEQDAAVWASADGFHWVPVGGTAEEFGGLGARAIFSLAPLGTGIVAVGGVNRGEGWQPASWISPDGQSWSPPSMSFASPSATTVPSSSVARAVEAVTTLDGSVSLVASGGGPSGQQAWRSTDGMHWTVAGLPAADQAATGWRATLVAATTTSIVVADGDPGQAHLLSGGSTWVEPSANPKVFGPVQPQATPIGLVSTPTGEVMEVRTEADPQTIGNAAYSLATYTSTDGSTWSPGGTWTSPATLPSSDARAAYGSGRWVAVSSGADAQTWTSTDGRTWVSDGPLDPAATATRYPTVTAVCVDGDTAVAVGSEQQPLASAGTSSSSSSSDTFTGRAAAAWSAPLVSATGETTTTTATTGSGVGAAWKRDPVSPPADPGATEVMNGCTTDGRAILAYGASAASNGTPAGAVWQSSPTSTTATGQATAWSRSLLPAGSSELDSVAPGPFGFGLATAGPSSVQEPVGSAGDTDSVLDPAIGPPASLGDGMNDAGVWLDEAGSWRLIDTSTLPWLGSQRSSADESAWIGGTAIVAGSVDGALTVWTGTYEPAASATTP